MHDDMGQIAILRRVENGMTDMDDADTLRRWLCPTEQERAVKGYLALTCNDAKKWIASDLRQGLAEILMEDL